jgi:hypothetical protein
MIMDMLKEPDWDAAESLLVEEGNRAIEDFSAKYAAELCSCFAFSVDYCFGDVVICFDTNDNSLLHAKRHEARALKSWDAALGGERGWENAQYYLQRDRLCSHNPHTADFKYANFAKLHLSDWEGYFGDDQLPERPDSLGHVIVLMHKAVSKLVAARSFDRLVMSSPFRVGVEFPRDDLGLVVMRVLNWPSHQGPRI